MEADNQMTSEKITKVIKDQEWTLTWLECIIVTGLILIPFYSFYGLYEWLTTGSIIELHWPMFVFGWIVFFVIVITGMLAHYADKRKRMSV